ncbi:MAG: adenylate/guanylate cyclase domain-containing protein [Planctomycetota bacterium]|jgi:adenylate cyclase|nr:MAG: adenylate/guanylate cyclase domain-containing protein [Planctomycetota bacterium]
MFKIQIKNSTQDASFEHFEGKLFGGRAPSGAGNALIIKDPSVSRTHFCIEAGHDGNFLLSNISSGNTIVFEDGKSLAPGSTAEFLTPNHFVIGGTSIFIQSGLHGNPSDFFSREKKATTVLYSPSKPEIQKPSPVINFEFPSNSHFLDNQSNPINLENQSAPEVIGKILKALENINKLQAELSVGEHYNNQIARQLVEMVDLDIGMVLLFTNNRWVISGCYTANENVSVRYSTTLVKNVVEQKKTFFQDLSNLEEKGQSLVNLEAAVISPILDFHDNVIGALYGARSKNIIAKGGITSLDAQLVQMLASTVGAGIVRERATKSKAQFEQFFSSELAKELDRNPNLLAGREQEITAMFSDLRGFTALSNLLKPAEICMLLQDIMEHLSEQIQIEGGVIVDYAGDGILAMWNAPVEQPDHVERACKAALAMHKGFPDVCKRWSHLLGDFPIGLGIGINTGVALVGNTGSKRKFKYGPMGLTVNLASRLEASTKLLGLPLVISASSKAKLSTNYPTRRLGQAMFPGVSLPVEIFECKDLSATSEWQENKILYETALQHFEAKSFGHAIKTLTPLIEKHGQGKLIDSPSLKLIRKSLEGLESTSGEFSSILWSMTK